MEQQLRKGTRRREAEKSAQWQRNIQLRLTSASFIQWNSSHFVIGLCSKIFTNASSGGFNFLEVADHCQDLFFTLPREEEEEEEEDWGDEDACKVGSAFLPHCWQQLGPQLFPSDWGICQEFNSLFLASGLMGLVVEIAGSSKQLKVPREDHDITMQVAVIWDKVVLQIASHWVHLCERKACLNGQEGSKSWGRC